MYCQNCGKEIQNDTTKFCPECGASMRENSIPTHNVTSASNKNAGLSNAMLLICALSAISAIALPVICYSNEANGQFLDIWWFQYAGGLEMTIFLAVIAVISGVIGLFTRKR